MSFTIHAPKKTSHLLFFATAMLIAGIWWNARNETVTPILAIVFPIIIFQLFVQKTICTKVLTCIFLGLVFFTGIFLFQYQQKNQNLSQEIICEKFCTVVGKIKSIEKSKQNFVNNLITIKLQKFKQPKRWWIKTNATIQIYTQKTENLFVADTVEIRNIFFKKPKNSSFNEFLIKQGVTATAFTPQLYYSVLYRPWFSLSRWIEKQKKNLYKKLNKKLSPESFSLFSSIFLGNKTIKKFSFEKAKNTFKNWGILHFLARSGLHLVIFILLWGFVLAYVPFSFRKKQITLILLSLLYYNMSWTSISFIRAFSVFLLYKLSPLVNIRTSGISLIFLVCLLTLIFNPIQLLFLDFQLSFSLACALAWFGQLQRQKRPLLKKC